MIRDAVKNDIDKIYDMQNEYFGSERFSIKSVEDYILNTTGLDTVKILEYDNEICGYIIYRVNDTIDLIQIAIDIKYRGKNYAKLLMDDMISHKMDRNIMLEVRSKNDIAISLYKKYDFKLINTIKNYYKDPTDDACIMELK